MLQEEAVAILETHGCIQRGHFCLRSGACSDTKVVIEPLETDPDAMMTLARGLVCGWEGSPDTYPEVVVGVERGGVLWGHALAYQLECRAPTRLKGTVRFVRARKAGGGMFRLLPEEAAIVEGKRVATADDVLTRGGTILKVRDVVRAVGGITESTAVIWYRGEENADTLGIGRVYALVSQPIPTLGDPCPLCAEGIPFSW